MGRWLLLVVCCLSAAMLGWGLADRFGVDPGRVPQPAFQVGEDVIVVGGERPVLAARSAATLRDTLFARHNGIPIDDRIASGAVRVVPVGSRFRVLECDLDLVRVRDLGDPGAAARWLSAGDVQSLRPADAVRENR